MNNINQMLFYDEEGLQPQERIDHVTVLQNAYYPQKINGIEQLQFNYNYGLQSTQLQNIQREEYGNFEQNNLYQHHYIQLNNDNNNNNLITQNQIDYNQQSHTNLHSVNFNQYLDEEQNSIKQLHKSEKGLYNSQLNDKLSSKCSFPEANLKKKRKVEINEDNQIIVQVKTNRELLEEKAVFNGVKINSGEVSYISYNDGIGMNNQASISQYCQARYLDEKNKRKKQQGQGNISDLIRMNECNANLWGFQRLDEDKKYDWVIEDIFIQNSWSANMGSGKSQMLGKGAFGNVIKVKDNNTQIQYALKFIKKSFFTKAITETEIMKQFNDDKFIIQYHDIYLYDQQMERNQVIEIQQYIVIVMELAQASLEDILKQRITCQAHWTSTELLTIMKHISLAVQSLAKKNIVHRDIKPSNILYCLKSQQYKLADFGEAKKVEEVNYEQPHTPRGTKRYMSPELLNSLISSKKSSEQVLQLNNNSPSFNRDQKDKAQEIKVDSHQFLPNFTQQQSQDNKIQIEENQNNQKMIENENFELKMEMNEDQKQSEKNKQKLELSIKIEKKKANNQQNESKQVQYEPYSNDIYSLGICFFQMKYLDDLSNYSGHEGKTLASEQYFFSKLQDYDAIDRYILKMIQFDPKKRPNIDQVIEFIENQLQRVSKDQEGITFNYEPSSSSNTIDQNQVLKSVNETQLINNPYQQNQNIPRSQSEIFFFENNANNNLINDKKQSKRNEEYIQRKSQNKFQILNPTNEENIKQNSVNINQNENSQLSSKNNSHKLCPKANPSNHSPLSKIIKKQSENTSEGKVITKSEKENERIYSIDEEECQMCISISQNGKNQHSQEQNDLRNSKNTKQEIYKTKAASQQLIYNLNNTFDNIRDDKIVVGCSKNNNIYKKNYSYSESDYEENSYYNSEYEEEEEEEMEREEEDDLKKLEESGEEEDNKNNSDSEQQQDIKKNKSINQVKRKQRRREKENIPQNLFEECKEDELSDQYKKECTENKVDELQFLKLMETKKQSNLSITQKIQYIIARAQAYESLLKFQKARDTFQELYEKHFQCLSPFDQINLLKNLGRLDHKMSKFDSSIKFYQQLLELLKQSKELNDLQISEVYQMLGSAHCFQGDYQAALKYYAESLSKKEMLKDSVEKEEIADLLVYIGLVKKHLQQYQSSLENYEKALEIVNQNPEKNLKRISCIKKNIGSVYDHMQNNTQSVQFLESALQDMIQAYGTENERVVNCLNKLGIVLVHSGQHNHEQAIKHFERAMKIMKKLYKMDTINESHRKQFRFKDDPLDEGIHPLYTRALQVNEEAYILYRQVYDYFHVGVGIILEIRGMIYHFLNDFQFALKYYNEAIKIYQIILKPEHEFVKRSLAFVNMANAEKKFQNFPKL